MATFRVLQWEGDEGGLSRRDRQDFTYRAYIPDPLQGRAILLTSQTTADVADAERVIAALQAKHPSFFNTETLARLLLRAESVASSRIEGLHVNARRLLRMEAASAAGEPLHDVTAAEVLANIDAMHFAQSQIRPGALITLELLLETHRRLLAGSTLAAQGGSLRTVQNWVGGHGLSPRGADFVPPPPDLVPSLMRDLLAFCNSDDHAVVVQAAMAHAQFEIIHPFVDGNGRLGRALIHLVLRRRAVVEQVLPPISLILATWKEAYVAGLRAVSYEGDALAAAACDGTNLWIARFSAACQRAVGDVDMYANRASALREAWRTLLGRVRARSATYLLLDVLLSTPILTVNTAARLVGRSFQQTNEAFARLEAAGIVKQISLGKRNRAFEASDVIREFTALERRLASPVGDTSVAKPTRPTPAKPAR